MPCDGNSALSSIQPLGNRETQLVRVPSPTHRFVAAAPRRRIVRQDRRRRAELLVLRGMRGLIEHDRAIIMAEVTDEWLSALGGKRAGRRRSAVPSAVRSVCGEQPGPVSAGVTSSRAGRAGGVPGRAGAIGKGKAQAGGGA
jgi:hypothetical protein